MIRYRPDCEPWLGAGRWTEVHTSGQSQCSERISQGATSSAADSSVGWRRAKMSNIRILIVDDHEIFRRGLRSLLQSRPDWEVCGEAKDGQDAVELAQQLHPDVVVLDITMPRLNGLDAARIIRRLVPETKVVILSQHELDAMRREAFKSGADAYVTKSEVSKELLAAIEGLS